MNIIDAMKRLQGLTGGRVILAFAGEKAEKRWEIRTISEGPLSSIEEGAGDTPEDAVRAYVEKFNAEAREAAARARVFEELLK